MIPLTQKMGNVRPESPCPKTSAHSPRKKQAQTSRQKLASVPPISFAERVPQITEMENAGFSLVKIEALAIPERIGAAIMKERPPAIANFDAARGAFYDGSTTPRWAEGAGRGSDA